MTICFLFCYRLETFIYLIGFSAVSLVRCLRESDLEDRRIPTLSSSPGWTDGPRDVTVLVGGTVTFKCRTYLRHRKTTWLQDGRQVAADHSKFTFSRDRETAFYGPVGVEDNGVSISCVVKTQYGQLPSSMGKITVYCECL